MSSERTAWGLLGLMLAIGFGAGVLTMSLTSSAGDSSLEKVSEVRDEEDEKRRARREAIIRAKRDRRDAEGPGENSGAEVRKKAAGLFSPALNAYALREMKEGWAEVRRDEIPEPTLEQGCLRFEAQTLENPRAIGRKLAEEAEALEAWDRSLVEGNGLAVLAMAAGSSERPPLEIVSDDEIWSEFFRSRSAEKLLRSGDPKRNKIEEGTTIELGAGVYDLSSFFDRWRQQKKLKDIQIRGAGKDATLIVLRSDISSGGDVERLAISDCTVNCNNNYFFDERRGGTVLTVERVRIVGFDMGAGGSCMMGCRRLMMNFRDCELLGGYSRTYVGTGRLFDVRCHGHAARFENCLVRHVEVGARNQGTLLFRNCRLEEILDSARRLSQQKGVHFVDSKITHFDRRKNRNLKFDLNDLFPEWKARLVRG